MYYIYILKCNDGSFYTGVTNNVEKRLYEHQQGLDKSCYTFSRRPVKCVYSEETKYVQDALEREKQIKGWSRKKKEALIERNEQALISLSKRKKKQA